MGFGGRRVVKGEAGWLSRPCGALGFDGWVLGRRSLGGWGSMVGYQGGARSSLALRFGVLAFQATGGRLMIDDF